MVRIDLVRVTKVVADHAEKSEQLSSARIQLGRRCYDRGALVETMLGGAPIFRVDLLSLLMYPLDKDTNSR